MTKWKWMKRPIEELTQEELVTALAEMGRRYYRLLDFYHAQCTASLRWMDTILEKESGHQDED